MYVTIGGTTYREIRNLSFAPEIDITGDSIPVNTLSVDIMTSGSIGAGQMISLYDDLNQRWCKFWIEYADVVDAGLVHVEAMSVIGLLDRYTLPAAIYTDGTSAYGLITQVMQPLVEAGVAWFNLDLSITASTVKGYFPEQTARERLQWICLAVGAYVKQSFVDPSLDPSSGVSVIEVKVFDDQTVTAIPLDKVYWKPSLEYKDYVTAIHVTSYNFAQRVPTGDEEYVTVDGVTYVMSSYRFTLTNPNVPAQVIPNEVSVDDVYIVNASNVSTIASNLALLYFARLEVDADVINNRDYEPSQMVTMPVSETVEATGYIEETDFSFGLQAKSKVRMVASESAVHELTSLLVKYMYNGQNLSTKRYSFPVGYSYQIENHFISKDSGTHRYVFRPINQYAEGTIVEGENVNVQPMDIALHFYETEKVLHIISVSDMEYDTESKELEIE